MTRREDQVRDLYRAFGDRDLDRVLAAMCPDVDWPNGWEGTRLSGREEVRDYWRRQWEQVRVRVVPEVVTELADGRVEARVRQVFRDPGGAVLTRERVVHLYTFEADLVARLDVSRA